MTTTQTTITGTAVTVLRTRSGDSQLLVEECNGARHVLVLATEIKAEARKQLKWKPGRERKQISATYFISSAAKIATAFVVL